MLTNAHRAVPGNRSFYKYVTAETAIIILETRSVRYSSPLKFNDPFDVQTSMSLDFDPLAAITETSRRLSSINSGSADPRIYYVPSSPDVAAYAPGTFPSISWKRSADAPSFIDVETYVRQLQAQYQAFWQDLLPRLRILCVSENDNLLMWAHYAKDHTGCVLRLPSIPGDRNQLSLARPVDYSTSPPRFFSKNEWVDSFEAKGKLDREIFDYKFACTKSEHWHYESEWRRYFEVQLGTDFHTDISIARPELTGIYFGERAATSFKAEASRLLQLNYPAAERFQARKHDTEYALIFDLL